MNAPKTHIETYGYKTLCGLKTRPLWLVNVVCVYREHATCKSCIRNCNAWNWINQERNV